MFALPVTHERGNPKSNPGNTEFGLGNTKSRIACEPIYGIRTVVCGLGAVPALCFYGAQTVKIVVNIVQVDAPRLST